MITSYTDMLQLLKKVISTPSVTRSEQEVSALIKADMESHGYTPECIGLNLLCYGHNYNPSKPTLLMNSHMDTVKPVAGWTKDPFTPTVEDGRLYGLGSNDDGAGLLSLLYSFYELDSKPQAYNPLFLATVEEEVNGTGGMKLAVGSSSRNTRFILKQTGLEEMFDAVSDGTNISRSKPDPEVFIKAAFFLDEDPKECMVVEDARAGIDAAKSGGMKTAGLGEAAVYERTDYPLESFSDLLKIRLFIDHDFTIQMGM